MLNRVAVVPSINPLIFKVCLENLSTNYVLLVMKDKEGHIIHWKFIFHEKKAVTKFNMSKLNGGVYTIEVSNKAEKHSFQIELVSKLVRSIEIKPGILATLPQ